MGSSFQDHHHGSVLFVWLPFLLCCTLATNNPPCDSEIYCHGPLLHTVQLSHIYDDDKTFVDQPLRFTPSEVLQNFSDFMAAHDSEPSNSDIMQFVDDNFYPTGLEFEPWIPSDWRKAPRFLAKIVDPELRGWGFRLHTLWKDLGRRIKEDIRLTPDQYSIIYVSHPFIVPGGRFREFYYWDSYWIQRGLLRSEMYMTVKGMIQNFLELVDELGYVPNGGRIYYRRSQPPLLISMMKSYIDVTQDIDFLRSSLSTLEKEFKFWLKHRMVRIHHNGKMYCLARYRSDKTGPRPESYSGDYNLASSLTSEEARNTLYTNIQSAAESGWDFSSRWFIPEEQDTKGNRSNTQTQNILPVDLNSILFRNAQILSEFFKLIGNLQKAREYKKIEREFQQTIQHIFWDDTLGNYFDYDMVNRQLVKDYYASSFAPLWTGVDTSPITISRIIKYMSSNQIFDFPGGIPTSLYRTGEQWDFPNAWPPLVHIAIEALSRSRDKTAQRYALALADKWIRSNFRAFNATIPNTMFEKYDAEQFGVPGSGGEYTVVAGFGWTNGVVIDLLSQYGAVLRAS